ncbi:MAG: sialidase family protein [Armatimonadota bacterium]
MPNDIGLALPHGPDNPRNTEGSFATLRDGRIMFAWSRYYGESWADEATARICARYSSDGGRTWTTEDRVIVENEGKRNVMSVSLLRLQDGRIGLFYLRKDGVQDCRLRMRASTDDGETWSKPALCIPAPGYFVVNNDRVIQLPSGRLIAPAAWHRVKGLSHRKDQMYAHYDQRGIIFFFLSDDGGRTWREAKDWWAHQETPRGALENYTWSGLQEPGAVRLKDGRVYAWCRSGNGYQYEMFSEDDGETWSAPQPSPFKSPCSPLSIKRIPSTGDLLAVWNDHSGELAPVPAGKDLELSWGRTPLVSAISSDEGKTWTHKKLLESAPEMGYCYTAIHFVEDAVLLSYGHGGGGVDGVLQNQRMRRMTVDWLYRA